MNEDVDLELALARMRILVAPDLRDPHKGDRPPQATSKGFSESAWATLHAELTREDEEE